MRVPAFAVFALFCLTPPVFAADIPYAQSSTQFAKTMATERANTQAIRDSMKFVNQAQKDTRSHWGQPIFNALQQVAPQVSAADSGKQEMAAAARFEALKDQQKIQVLTTLANQGYVPAMVELGEAHLNGDLGLRADAQAALVHLRAAAKHGDASAAYNTGIAYGRLGQDAAARPYFEQAAQAGVRGSAYKVALEAVYSEDWKKAIHYGKQAAADKSAIGAYIVCLAAQVKSADSTDALLPAEYCPMAYELGYLDGAEDAGISLAKQGEWPRAYQYYLRCIERSGHLSCQRNAGLSAFKSNQWPEADRLLSKAIAAGDNNEDAQLVLALIAMHGEPKQWDKAEQMLKAVLKHEGAKSAEAHFHMGELMNMRPDQKYSDDQVNNHYFAAARGGYVEAQEMVRAAGLSW
jgi:TPR repeat protein